MAVRSIAQTDTLETFRTQFNALAADDFGDIGTLDSSLSATSVIGAVNEINSVVQAAAGWFIEDASSTIQAVGSGQTLKVFGISNQTTAVVSSPDTFTVGLTDTVSITTKLTSPIIEVGNLTLSNGSITDSSGSINFGNENIITTGDIEANNVTAPTITTTGGSSTLGTIQIVGNTISSTDSTEIKIDDSLQVNGILKAGNIEINPSTGYASAGGFKSLTGFIAFDGIPVINGRRIAFEGDVEDDHETSLVMTEPTADRVIDFPNASGEVILDTSTTYATSTIFSNSVTLNIYNSAGVLQKTIVGSAS